MRFFETMACGAPALVSSCPEMEPAFPEGAGAVYFADERELVSKAKALLDDGERRQQMAEEGHRRVIAGHTYVHRAREVLEAIDLSP